jgi:hypothetical protein
MHTCAEGIATRVTFDLSGGNIDRTTLGTILAGTTPGRAA